MGTDGPSEHSRESSQPQLVGLGDGGGHGGLRECPGSHGGVVVCQAPLRQDVGKRPKLIRALSRLLRRRGGASDHLLHPVLEHLVAKVVSVPEVPVETAAGHPQLAGHARDAYALSDRFLRGLLRRRLVQPSRAR